MINGTMRGTMRGIMKISLGVFIVVLIINSGGQVLAKTTDNDKFDLSAIENRKIAVKSDRLWNQGIIPYIIKKALAWRHSWYITRAIKFWEKNTCVKFINFEEDQHPNYLLFTKSENNDNNRLGKFQDGKNTINISRKFSYEIVVREVGHAMGFVFENEPEYEKLQNKTENSDMVYQCPTCGKTMQEPTGTFGTPVDSNNSLIKGNGPEICEWRISGARSDKIVLNIESMNIYSTPNCTADYIEVRDGYWSGSPLIGRFCGNKTILPIKSQSDRMLVTYVKTSDKKDYYGFKASYYTTCGGDVEINNKFVYLETPYFPENYPPNSQCTWNITYPQNKTLRIINYFFNLKVSSGCQDDFLEIRDGFDFNSFLIGRYCGTHMSSRTNATGGNVQFRFSSVAPIKDSGFSILVRATDDHYTKVKLEKEKSMPGSASHQAFSLGLVFFISLVSLFNLLNK